MVGHRHFKVTTNPFSVTAGTASRWTTKGRSQPLRIASFQSVAQGAVSLRLLFLHEDSQLKFFFVAVPVVAIFTKFDALEDKAYGELENEGLSHQEVVAQAPGRAVTDFENEHLPYLYGLKYPPGGHVYLRGNAFVFLSVFTAARVDGWGSDMDKPETDCRELTQTVAAVLDDDNLKRLFVSTQQNNLELCIKLAVSR